jgi:hypothetical protein
VIAQHLAGVQVFAADFGPGSGGHGETFGNSGRQSIGEQTLAKPPTNRKEGTRPPTISNVESSAHHLECISGDSICVVCANQRPNSFPCGWHVYLFSENLCMHAAAD